MSEKRQTTQPNQPNHPSDVPIFYDRNAVQRIPLDSIDNGVKSRSWHHLKPLSNERYFQLENEIDRVQYEGSSNVRDILKPKYDLWRELFIEREGFKEKDTDALFIEGVQAVTALLYYENIPPREAEEGELIDYDADESMYFGAMYSGAWLGLRAFFKSELRNYLDEYQTAVKPVRSSRLEQSVRSSGGSLMLKPKVAPYKKVEKIYRFAAPFLTKADGFAESENAIDAVPAWHVVNAAADIFAAQLEMLSGVPVITGVYGK